MPEAKTYPLTEMALTLQYNEARPFSPNQAVAIHNAVRKSLPTIDIVGRLNLGMPDGLVLSEEHPAQRWWFSSQSGERLLQFQDDAVSANWRHRSQIGEAAPDPYPGFEEMVRRLGEARSLWMKHTHTEIEPPAHMISVLYDNLWPHEERMADTFEFWNHMGISGPQIGPELKWRIMLTDPILGSQASINILAGLGAMSTNDQLIVKAARLQLSATASPDPSVKVEVALAALRTAVGDYFRKLLTPSARKSWDV